MLYSILGNANKALKKREKFIFLQNAAKILVLDGAFHLLKKLEKSEGHVFSEYSIVGDMDSIDRNILMGDIEDPDKKIAVIQDESQEDTDLYKAIEICLEEIQTYSQNHLKSVAKNNLIDSKISLYNVIGGRRFDHSICNLISLKRFSSPSVRIIIFTNDNRIECIRNRNVAIRGEINQNVAVIPFNEAIVTSMGLKYEMNSLRLKMPKSTSVSNNTISKEAKMMIRGCAILITDIYSDVIPINSIFESK